MNKRCKVIMLAANEKAENFNNTIVLDGDNNLTKISAPKEHIKAWSNLVNKFIEPQYLYITSTDEIRQGDWYIAEHPKGYSIIPAIAHVAISTKFKKVIATTDSILNLPQPSKLFIDKYITEYNKDNVIKDIMVEYKTNSNWEACMIQDIAGRRCVNCNIKNHLQDTYECLCGNSVKINPKDNTITIRSIKDSWNREEVIILLQQFGNNLEMNHPSFRLSKRHIERYIEDNL